MRVLFLILAGAGLAAPVTGPAFGQAAVASTFDSDGEGWTVFGDAQGTSNFPTYSATGGNPDGYIRAADDVTGGVWYFSAPAAFLGDQSAAYGQRLTFDLKQSQTDAPFNADDIVVEGAGLVLVYNTLQNPGSDWTSYQVPMAPDSQWTVKATGVRPTEAEFRSVLGALTALRIRGEYRTGADTGSLDNVVLERQSGTGTEEDEPTPHVAVSGPFPNPLRSRGEVTVSSARGGTVTVTLHDAQGRLVRSIYEGQLAADEPLRLDVDGSGLASGVYLLRFTGAGWSAGRTIVVVK